MLLLSEANRQVVPITLDNLHGFLWRRQNGSFSDVYPLSFGSKPADLSSRLRDGSLSSPPGAVHNRF
jgi:hypothetical protein